MYRDQERAGEFIKFAQRQHIKDAHYNTKNIFSPNNRLFRSNDLEQQTEHQRLVMLDHASDIATLSKCPRTLYALWNEYEFGLNGQKAAKNFTSQEWGRNRFTYSRRKVFWDKAIELVKAGHTSFTAIDLISSVYRNCSVTQTINTMMKDKRNSWPTDLQV